MPEISTERATHVREITMQNITHRDRRSEGCCEEIFSLADVVIALDRAVESSIDIYGGSGTGAGAYLEAVVVEDGEEPEDARGERVESVNDVLFAGLPLGDPKHLRDFIAQQKRNTCWNGNNHVTAPYYHSERLLERIRGR